MSLENALRSARQKLWLDPENRDWISLQLYAREEDGDDFRPIIFRPYRGLSAFQPEDSRFFFGRDREVTEILKDLQGLIEQKQPRFLVVAGASGTGKSSLVLAGAVPKLKEAKLQYLYMRPGSDPEGALKATLVTRSLGEAALLIVDQFEEVFTQTLDPAVRNAFAQRLWALAKEPEPGLRVLITLRVDFIGRCGELVLDPAGLRLDQIAYAEEHRVFVAQLNPDQLHTTIEEPARRVGLQWEEGLVDSMLRDVGNEP